MSSSLATAQAREKGIVGGKDHGRSRNKLQWDGRLFSSDWCVCGDKKRVDPWSAAQAWSRSSLSRLQSSFFSEGQLDKGDSLSRIPWLKWYRSPLLHVKIDIYEAVWSLTPQVFFFLLFFGEEGVPGTVCQIFIRDIAKHFSFLLLCSQDAPFPQSTVFR